MAPLSPAASAAASANVTIVEQLGDVSNAIYNYTYIVPAATAANITVQVRRGRWRLLLVAARALAGGSS